MSLRTNIVGWHDTTSLHALSCVLLKAKLLNDFFLKNIEIDYHLSQKKILMQFLLSVAYGHHCDKFL